nr:hypothetical protein [Escherichia coli]
MRKNNTAIIFGSLFFSCSVMAANGTLAPTVVPMVNGGQERDRSAISEREAALPESVLRESQREREAVREVARENLLQERLQQMERDMVRDLQKEKTLGGD